MNDRLELHSALVEILGEGKVYYQPPQNVRLSYPCCVYFLDRVVNRHADNSIYNSTNQYGVTLISKDPEDPAFDKIMALPYAAFDHHFVSDNLHHFEFVIKVFRS